jgi:DNA-binding response OmpR family regulator
VVDDEPKILDIVRSYLEKNGYRALTAKNGKEALAALHSNSVALMLLDLMLPDLSGEELCRRVRAESDMPIIMMTAKVDEESIIRGLRIGADDYVTKPFSPRQLMARVAAALRRAGGGACPGMGRPGGGYGEPPGEQERKRPDPDPQRVPDTGAAYVPAP